MPSRRASTRCSTEAGQGSVEFAIVTSVSICVIVALAALWHAFGDGLLVEHALMSASHHVQSASAGAVIDVYSY